MLYIVVNLPLTGGDVEISCQSYLVKVRSTDLPSPARLFQLDFSRAGKCLQGMGIFHSPFLEDSI